MNHIYSYVKQIYNYLYPIREDILDTIIKKINLLHVILKNYFIIYPSEIVGLIMRKSYNARELYCFLKELIQHKQPVRVFAVPFDLITAGLDIRSYIGYTCQDSVVYLRTDQKNFFDSFDIVVKQKIFKFIFIVFWFRTHFWCIIQSGNFVSIGHSTRHVFRCVYDLDIIQTVRLT